ncbi:ZIP zinc transporter [Pleurostoma richardsiae]|uniref:ZIP zinc transporter n=1 Tax=Pleurostoma richardsiae TaxID=41990 RepID=A0AA38VHX3_9PEZI|nr:ZIP zinc transporter [Pleurostoma richardsiae]
MEAAEVQNDTRGWIMCIVSGIACVFGACVICVDLLVRLIPGKHNFRIQESNGFLACSLSLSFGVMIFSALYSMLPSSKRDLMEGGYGEVHAGLIMMGCFVGGFIGIQGISRLLHQFIPSHVVECDHTHDEHAFDNHSEATSRKSRPTRGSSRRRSSNTDPAMKIATINEVTRPDEATSESTPLLPTEPSNGTAHREAVSRSSTFGTANHGGHAHEMFSNGRKSMGRRRPSMVEVQKRVISFVKDTKSNCDGEGPCYGYSDPCGQGCFKHINTRTSISRVPTFLRTTPASFFHHHTAESEGDIVASPGSPAFGSTNTHSVAASLRHSHGGEGDEGDENEADAESYCDQMSEDLEAQHHHHVAENAFLSIGLQTVIAIALHKFPEGFITYATNHANPTLGFNVFMALFVHNIAEGFAMALPLYMALGSRLKAILWSSLLGGLSQPLGAGIAVLWFRVARKSHITIDGVAYACLFAITAGIMTSVALQLFVESLSLNHNRNLSIAFAFIGMLLLGVSNALVTH